MITGLNFLDLSNCQNALQSPPYIWVDLPLMSIVEDGHFDWIKASSCSIINLFIFVSWRINMLFSPQKNLSSVLIHQTTQCKTGRLTRFQWSKNKCNNYSECHVKSTGSSYAKHHPAYLLLILEAQWHYQHWYKSGPSPSTLTKQIWSTRFNPNLSKWRLVDIQSHKLIWNHGPSLWTSSLTLYLQIIEKEM